MALDPGAIIRGASGILFIVLGVAIIAIARRASQRRLAIGLALYCIGFGTAFVAFNFFSRVNGPRAEWVSSANVAAWTLASIGAALVLSMLVPRRVGEWALLAAVIVVPLAASLAGTAQDPSPLPLDNATNAALRVGAQLSVGIALALALKVARGEEPPTVAGGALLAAGLVLFPAMFRGETWSGSSAPLGLETGTIHVLALGIVSLAWLRAAHRVSRPALLFVAWSPLALILTGQIEDLLFARQTGLLGIVRILAGFLIAYAILREDLLGAKLRIATMRRGTLAAVGLASLFVVAQMAAPFVSGAVGLVLGGIVAGGLTLAGPIVQRLVEPPGPVTREASDEKLSTYRDAVRYALRDGTMTRKEEMHLARLAQQLGIGAADALRVRHEVEDAAVREKE